jgi:hypothetical protein
MSAEFLSASYNELKELTEGFVLSKKYESIVSNKEEVIVKNNAIFKIILFIF